MRTKNKQMEKLKITLCICILAGLVFLSSCKDDDDCPDHSNPACGNYDANYGKPSADFTMRQTLQPWGWTDKPEEIAEFCDTIVRSNPGVLFTAKEEDALRYEWTIGDDNRRFDTREVALNFNSYLRDTNNIWKPIPIKLKVVKVPDAPHSPADSVYTSERFLVFADEFLWNGTFEGYFEHEPDKKRVISYDFTSLDTFEVPEHSLIPCPSPCMVTGISLHGFLPKDTLNIQFRHIIRGGFPDMYSFKQRKWQAAERARVANMHFIDLSSGVTYFHAYAEHSPDGRHELRLEYRHQTERNGKETTYVFNGKKIK